MTGRAVTSMIAGGLTSRSEWAPAASIRRTCGITPRSKEPTALL
jgi:hypothetical protein